MHDRDRQVNLPDLFHSLSEQREEVKSVWKAAHVTYEQGWAQSDPQCSDVLKEPCAGLRRIFSLRNVMMLSISAHIPTLRSAATMYR
jgi:hypothetical protein